MSGPKLFCFGMGYVAQALAAQQAQQGWAVAGTHRSESIGVAPGGATRWVFDSQSGAAMDPAAFDGITHVLLSIPPDGDGDPVLRRHADDLAAQPGLRWIGYLSTTGVYGDQAGGTADEATALGPSNERGARRVAAESAWQAFGAAHGKPVAIFRLAGIYGPGRSALTRLRAGTAHRIDKPGLVFSRVHRDDIVAAVTAALTTDRAGIYNLCDDLPAAPADVTAFGAELLGLPSPPLEPLESAAISPMLREFYGANRRVDNSKAKRELGWRLKYPSYREGLSACLQAELATSSTDA